MLTSFCLDLLAFVMLGLAGKKCLSPHHGKGHFLGAYLGMSRLGTSRHTQCYSTDGSSDVFCGYQSAVTTWLFCVRPCLVSTASINS